MSRVKAWGRAISTRIGSPVAAFILAVAGLVVLVLAYAVPPFRGNTLWQVLGAALLGAGLSAWIGAVTGQQAIRHQAAKEANLRRKEDTYGPLYAELKAVRGAFAQAEAKEIPAPQWIDNGVEVKREGITIFPSSAPGLTLMRGPEFRRDYRDTDFKAPTRSVLDDVQALATKYNNAVEAARRAAIPILATHIDAALAAERQSDNYTRWKQRQADLKEHPRPVGHEPKTPYDWYGYLDYMSETLSLPSGWTPGRQLAEEWLGRWPSPQQSHALGWLLAGQPDKAASYVQLNYPAEGGVYPRPPLDWIHPIFERAWPDLQQDSTFSAALDAMEVLLQRVQEAEAVLESGLGKIQELYEGGEPLV